MIQLRYFNNKLQQQDDLGEWHEVPVVIDPDRPPTNQCAHCGEIYVNEHSCWLQA